MSEYGETKVTSNKVFLTYIMKFIYIMAIILLWVNVILTYDSVKGIVAVLLTLLIIRLYKNKKIVKNSHKKRDL
ncbi:hypothetical protein A4A32_04800 [Staphylococcus equorum]|uniref:hypothetical protein n=2 Tax=Staphylococcus TaxID=1279 RepID=UPI0007048A06|nr:hypothetical protein [Staphylococcus equorum]ANK37083.1 hypothetical protein AOB58_281 [Staphylococcus sp. AntiMn-1]ALM57270.1 hypothetical protein SE1039_14870 [Staphylococcus equorum]OIS53374.1 hypothetical protein A4A29_01320 [Staphylococcus equorum]OIS58932.1 hypothetical protein A4A34_08190 [Staphylococcus equorum]OIS60394.1 hypothetical protein A4A32_04800 [Staphylococcus equorum]